MCIRDSSYGSAVRILAPFIHIYRIIRFTDPDIVQFFLFQGFHDFPVSLITPAMDNQMDICQILKSKSSF